MLPDPAWQPLFDAAASALRNAHCPYSHFPVGSAVQTADGAIAAGTNVENASYSLTVCAERNAIAAAVAGGMRPAGLLRVLLVSATPEPVVPCGACLQVIAEFAAPECRIVCYTLEQQCAVHRLNDLLPEAFNLPR